MQGVQTVVDEGGEGMTTRREFLTGLLGLAATGAMVSAGIQPPDPNTAALTRALGEVAECAGDVADRLGGMVVAIGDVGRTLLVPTGLVQG